MRKQQLSRIKKFKGPSPIEDLERQLAEARTRVSSLEQQLLQLQQPQVQQGEPSKDMDVE